VFRVSAILRPKNAPKVDQPTIREEMARAAEDGFTEAESGRRRKRRGKDELTLQRSDRRVGWPVCLLGTASGSAAQFNSTRRWKPKSTSSPWTK